MRYIPDEIGEVVSAVDAVLSQRQNDPFNVYFDFGHYAEITRNLTEKGESRSLKHQKYPLVWLVMDFEETRGTRLDLECSLSCQIIIAMDTRAEIPMQKRRDEVFLARLYPIYEELLNQFSKSKVFGKPAKDQIQHTKVDRPYWGGQESGNGQANLFNDFIDAIQIKGLKLDVRKQQCAPSL